MIGQTLSHYKVLDEISRGGMGIVYRALDVKLNREVALKVLPPELVADPERKRRFVQEAQAAAALEHPHIAVVYEIDEANGVTFIAMELIRGEQLSDTLARAKLSADRALELAIEIAEGLASAHGKGVVHRDLKPANIMVTGDGHAKVIDFGLAKLIEPAVGPESEIDTALRDGTGTGVVMGTLSHMSPEQARGQTVDHRTDVFSFGILLHEMLTGDPPFTGPSAAEVQYAIIHERTPRMPREHSELQTVLDRCLAKDPDDRYQSMADVQGRLRDVQRRLVGAPASLTAAFMRPAIVVVGALLLVVAAVFIVLAMRQSERERWAREEALPEIARLVEEDQYARAFHLASEAAPVLGDDPAMEAAWSRLSRPVTISTEPSGADVYFRSFPEGSGDEIRLGTSPVEGARLPLGSYWLRVEREGFRPVEALMPPSGLVSTLTVQLDALETAPPGMVRIRQPSLGVRLAGFDTVPQFESPDYWIDATEVTNRAYKRFVDSGGYEEPEYWTHDVVKEGRVLSFDESRTEFRDRTGRPGPSTWAGGAYPEGEDDHPVSGVSWYEAAAYATFSDRHLPTLYHWTSAAETRLSAEILTFSNFDGHAPGPVGSRPPGPFGTHDMAGNVKEWAWNKTSGARYILGGAWNDPTYMFFENDTRDPLDRAPENGFRTVLYSDPADPNVIAMSRPIERLARRTGLDEPVSDAIFHAYLAQFEYDLTPLESVVESVDESSQYWTKEKITYTAAYGGERLIAYLFLPKNVEPPYQTILYFPGSSATRVRSSETLGQMRFIDFLVMSGRAVLYPVYKGTHERHDSRLEFTDANSSRTYAEFVTQWVKDARRSLDYLESRAEVDPDRIGFEGLSWGARLGNIVLAVEDRLKVGVLIGGGFPYQQPRPEVAETNFAPRVDVPVIMLNGTHDSIFPLETNQKPMFELLGASPKEHILYESGHVLAGHHNQMSQQILEWLDRHLGPI